MSRFARALGLCLLLGAPFWLSARHAATFIPSLSHAVVAPLLRVARPLAASEAPPAGEAVVALPDANEVAVGVAKIVLPPPRAKATGKAKPGALFVSAATVLALAQSAARPRGTFVTQTATQPAGLLLSGVAGLGIGLQDGDILIEALGIKPRGPGEVIGAVIEARAKNARLLSGTVWRRGETFRITVEQPYLPHSG